MRVGDPLDLMELSGRTGQKAGPDDDFECVCQLKGSNWVIWLVLND